MTLAKIYFFVFAIAFSYSMHKVCSVSGKEVLEVTRKLGTNLLINTGSSIDMPESFFDFTIDLEEDETSDQIKRSLSHMVLMLAFSSFLMFLFYEEKRKAQKKVTLLVNSRFAAFLQIFRL